ncbi:phage tail protein [Salmonella enterica subsp. enterica serovar Telelkebir]|nr:phage tail protein [Salmonella enterica subsp. enterica serovar Telelkebir]ECZ9741608.1 phage tail protein [Salmonella enterica subsp. enterica serovar Telelkebir]MIN79503.1 phage tail protein [Salmonella enterica subsp. enterica]
MITGEKKLLRAWALYLPLGIRLQGAHEYTPPAINIAKLDIKTGAMDAPVPVDDGMEALSCSFKIYGYDVGMLTLLGLQAGLYSPEITVRQAYRVGNADSGQVETLQGMIVSITPDLRPATSLGEASVSVDMALSYYRQAVDGVETICIIPEEFVRRINGVNVLGGLKKIIRI